jgi:Tol biopolymer transport system component
VILFAPNQDTGLFRVSDKGGLPTQVTQLDAARFETQQVYPRFLPDGRHFVFFTKSAQPEHTGIRVGSLDQAQTQFLMRSHTNAEYSEAGYLVFMRERKILAQPFDVRKLALNGDPVTLIEQAHFTISAAYTPLSVFSNHLLIYRAKNNPNMQLAWYDRSGKQLSVVGAPGEYHWLNLSPDSKQVILERFEPEKASGDLWSFDLTRGTLTRQTASPVATSYPLWSADGKHIAFSSPREGVTAIWQKDMQSSGGKEELLFKEGTQPIWLEDWSSNGEFIVFSKSGEKGTPDLWLFSLGGERQPKPFLATQFQELRGKVSPNGHWIAYRSDESGSTDIYVQSFPEPGRKVAVSQGGGNFPRWRRDGKELYYVAADGKLMAVPVETGTSFSAGTPVALFDVGTFGWRNNRYLYDVSADGQNILLLRPLEDAATRPLTVVQNWTALLKK